ncbi:MAG: hypothetical protein OHK0039_47640 [Bacteroidia bacterium]
MPTLSELELRFPPAWSEPLLAQIRESRQRLGLRIVVYCDDAILAAGIPNAPVLPQWDADSLHAALDTGAPLLYLLAGSRDATPDDAHSLAHDTGGWLRAWAAAHQAALLVVYQCDAALRSPIATVAPALAAGLGQPGATPVLSFTQPETGFYTAADMHYVVTDKVLMPVFIPENRRRLDIPFEDESLAAWAAAHFGTTPAALTLDVLRREGPAALARHLSGKPLLVETLGQRDLEVLAMAALSALEAGQPFLLCSTVALLPVLMGMASQQTPADLESHAPEGDYGGLWISGSCSALAGAQLLQLQRMSTVYPVKFSLEAIIDEGDAYVEARRSYVLRQLEMERDVLLTTSREYYQPEEGSTPQDLASRIHEALDSLVGGLGVQPRYLVVQGSATAAHLARALTRTQPPRVLGTALPGVPAWKLGEDAVFPGLLFVPLPGHAGDVQALVRLDERIEGE